LHSLPHKQRNLIYRTTHGGQLFVRSEGNMASGSSTFQLPVLPALRASKNHPANLVAIDGTARRSRGRSQDPKMGGTGNNNYIWHMYTRKFEPVDNSHGLKLSVKSVFYHFYLSTLTAKWPGVRRCISPFSRAAAISSS
jgi:hypothetical protein